MSFLGLGVPTNIPTWGTILNGDVDYQAVRSLGRYIVNKGIKAVYVCGSTGEGFLLDNEERMKVVEELVAEVGDELKIIVHVGTASTRHSMMLAEHAEKAGAHDILRYKQAGGRDFLVFNGVDESYISGRMIQR